MIIQYGGMPTDISNVSKGWLQLPRTNTPSQMRACIGWYLDLHCTILVLGGRSDSAFGVGISRRIF
jgi:hypothetical protein